MNIPGAKIITYGLLLALVASVVTVSRLIRQNRRWKEIASGMAEYQGIQMAKDDFRAGRLQLYIPIDDRREDAFLGGSNFGPFKVCPLSTNPYDAPSSYIAAQVAEAYNRRMRALHEHPERYVAMTNAEGRIEWK